MLSSRIQNELNEQINAEFWSAYLYLSMSAWFSSKNLPGFANWMYVQFQEEQSHAMKIFRYLCERGGKVTLKPVMEVPTSWEQPSEVFDFTLKHEQKVTEAFNRLMDSAVEVKDYATQNFLNWFVTEQVEEEANVGEILQTLADVDNRPEMLRMMDRELKARTFND